MSARKPAILFIATAATSLAMGAEPIYTDPVGFVKMGNSAADGVATPAIPAFTDARIAPSLETGLLFSGTFLSSTGNDLTVDGTPNWDPGVWSPSSGTTYSLTVIDGTEAGLRGLIEGNTTDTVSLVPTTAGLLSSIDVGDKIEIRKTWTVKDFFANSDITPGIQVLFFDGLQAGTNPSNSSTVIWNGTNWIYFTGAPTPPPPNANGHLIHPGESFIIRTGPNPINRLTVFGDVPLAPHRMTFTKQSSTLAQDTTFGFFYPTPKLLSEANLGFFPGDQLLVFDPAAPNKNKSNIASLIYNGTGWQAFTGITAAEVPTFKLNPGVGYIFRHGAPRPAGDYDWRDLPEP